MRELAILTSGILGYCGIVLGITLMAISMKKYLQSDEPLEGIIGAGVFLFLAGALSLIVMFSVGLSGAK